VKRIRSPSLEAPPSRIFTRLTSTGSIPVAISRRTMPMPNETVTSVSKLQILRRGKERFGLQLYRLGTKLPRTRPQGVHQRIFDLIRLTKPDNVAILIHGVSFPSGDSGGLITIPDTPPFSSRHHPVSRIALVQSDLCEIRLRTHAKSHPGPHITLQIPQCYRFQVFRAPSGGNCSSAMAL